MRELPTQLAHYVSRFFSFFRLHPLMPSEQAMVRTHLRAEEAPLFWEMQGEDQRHSYEMAMRVTKGLPGDEVAFATALLHDVGKRHFRLGPIARSIATMGGHLHAPMPASMRSYWSHGSIGAEDLDRIGSDPYVVAFAEDHGKGVQGAPGDPRWAALIAADR